MNRHILNIYRLILKEIQTLLKDRVMLFLMLYAFSFAVYIGAKATSNELVNAPIAFVDEDKSALSFRIIDSFYKPMFNTPRIISYDEMDKGMDRGLYTFVVVIPNNFEKSILKGDNIDIQLNIDATRMSQAGIGAGYISQIISQEVASFFKLPSSVPKIELISTYKYNPNLTGTWFGSINKVIDNILTFSILLSAAALMREREHGTIEHLLVMPVSAFEIMLSKILATMFVILLSVIFSLHVVVDVFLQVPLAGSMVLFLFSTFLVLFSTTSIGIFIGIVTKSMPQLGMMFMLIVLPLMMLSGGITPYESMPKILQYLMYFSPTTHFINIAQAILFRGAGIEVIWPHLTAIFFIGLFFFIFTLVRFKRSLK